MYYTPGWGALLTVIGTLSGGVVGGVLTQWGQRRLYRRQLADQHRLEKRESIASVLDASAPLHEVKRLVHHAGEVNKDREAGKYSAGLPLPNSVLAFNKELTTFDEKTNLFRSQLRRALLVVDDRDLVDKLRALQTVAVEISSHAESIKDHAAAQETFDVTKLEDNLAELSKRTRNLSDAAVARLKATG
jgi:hypothetical protein